MRLTAMSVPLETCYQIRLIWLPNWNSHRRLNENMTVPSGYLFVLENWYELMLRKRAPSWIQAGIIRRIIISAVSDDIRLIASRNWGTYYGQAVAIYLSSLIRNFKIFPDKISYVLQIFFLVRTIYNRLEKKRILPSLWFPTCNFFTIATIISAFWENCCGEFSLKLYEMLW